MPGDQLTVDCDAVRLAQVISTLLTNASVAATHRAAVPRLVAVTGHGQDEDRALARGAGFDDHIVKPVDVDDLFARLVRLAPNAVS